tara:strand:- start:36 stop:425 length:390 start_codon:yes stop_codon:yes gene_type:complete
MPLLDRAFGIHQHALPLRNARISTLAANIANADTPGYKAKDVDFAKAIKAHKGEGAMTVTDKRHYRHPSVSSGSFPTFLEKALNPSPDGNTVEIGVQQAKFGRAAGRYEATLNFIEGRVSGIRKALKGE